MFRFDLDHGDHMLDDRWFHVTWFSYLSHIRCHTGAYFHFRWGLPIFMELHDHLHLRSMSWDDDVFVTLSWSLSRASLEPFSSTHIFGIWLSPSLLFRRRFIDVWGLIWVMEIAHLMMDDFMSPNFRLIVHLTTYWGIFPFWSRFTNLHGVACLSPLTRYTPRWWPICYLIMIP